MASYVPAVLIALLMFSHATDAMASMASEDLAFFYFVLLWPAGICKQTQGLKCCKPLTGEPAEEDFYLKGLYPSDISGNYITGCNDCSFNNNEISGLEEDLQKYASNITCPSTNSTDSWKTLWETYGVCSGLGQHYYFKKSLELLKQIDMLSILSKHDITPTTDHGHDYTVAEISEAIKTETTYTASIKCSSNDYADYELLEIHLCFDKDATTIIECPVLPTFTCPDYVEFATYSFKDTAFKAANPIRMSVPE
ncbi:hypothetical protein HHK36_026486 [Tetracentron sinense]|uniref:Uncharacterized protein n=1 Tax=Tetracentron sinense TaxID=13715 RepID=A0A834YJR5_TETSI|nr:hypothetical protein HHK36_026486 [Tetracentron sinense]